MKIKKNLELKRITGKNEREHKTFFKVTRIIILILSLPITLPLYLLSELGELAEILGCAITDIMTKVVNNIFKWKYYDECRDLDEWEIEELEEQKARKKMKKEERKVKYYVD